MTGREATPACEWCGRALRQVDGAWWAVKGEERGYHPPYCDAADDSRHSPASTGREAARSFVADVLHDCLSSFQGLDHGEGVCCFDRDAAVEYLLSPASGLTITVEDA